MSRPAGVDPRITPPRSARPIEKTTHQAPLFSGLLELHPGGRFRILNAAITVDDDEPAQPVVITLGVMSEVFVVG